MNRQDLFYGLQLDDDFLADDQVDFVSAIQLQAFIRDREIDLAFERKAAEMQFVTETLFVGGFEQAGTQLTMDFNSSTNDRSGPRILLAICFLDVLNSGQSSHGKNFLPQSRRGTERTSISEF